MRKNFDEYFAKVVLEFCFPEKFANLQVLDKPDLQSGQDVGIEVTNCMPKEVAEAFNLWHRVAKQGDQTPPRILERLQQLDMVQLENGKLIWNQGTYTENIENSPLRTFIDAVASKVEKLNSPSANYADLRSYELFVNSALDIDTGDLKTILAILEKLKEVNTKSKKFDMVYLIAINKTMFIFDLVNSSFIIKYLYNRLDVLARQARKRMRES